jgi:hypothetical protein
LGADEVGERHGYSLRGSEAVFAVEDHRGGRPSRRTIGSRLAGLAGRSTRG